ncbi:unnamed protein product [Meloidogyne enterolobii]|uniref:Uncharacterized protein n=1 Tax=Meloidogyne enterolobii TaxID=390850 RepID=A0ACB1B5N2_MELEN
MFCLLISCFTCKIEGTIQTNEQNLIPIQQPNKHLQNTTNTPTKTSTNAAPYKQHQNPKEQQPNKHLPNTTNTPTTLQHNILVVLPLEKLPKFCSFYKLKQVFSCCYALYRGNFRYPRKLVQLSPSNNLPDECLNCGRTCQHAIDYITTSKPLPAEKQRGTQPPPTHPPQAMPRMKQGTEIRAKRNVLKGLEGKNKKTVTTHSPHKMLKLKRNVNETTEATTETLIYVPLNPEIVN